MDGRSRLSAVHEDLEGAGARRVLEGRRAGHKGFLSHVWLHAKADAKFTDSSADTVDEMKKAIEELDEETPMLRTAPASTHSPEVVREVTERAVEISLADGAQDSLHQLAGVGAGSLEGPETLEDEGQRHE